VSSPTTLTNDLHFLIYVNFWADAKFELCNEILIPKEMKKILLSLAIVSALFFSTFAFALITNWKIANGYSVKFTSKDPSGIFESMKGELVFDENNLAMSHFAIWIDVSSINTGNFLMNRIAKSSYWFDCEHYPTIRFISTRISKTVSGYETTGTIEIHGIRKQITIPFTFKNNTFSGSFNINRLDFKVGTADGIDAHASTNLFIELSIPVQK
jgi:polyisoprenoid-binding protein YceI